jgi:hypothetical protein
VDYFSDTVGNTVIKEIFTDGNLNRTESLVNYQYSGGPNGNGENGGGMENGEGEENEEGEEEVDYIKSIILSILFLVIIVVLIFTIIFYKRKIQQH